MSNDRCRIHGGASTGPRTREGLARSRRARWKHGFYSAEVVDCKAGRHDDLTISDVWEACEARGIEPYPYCRYLDEDGKLVEATHLYDTLGMMRQLGVVSAPVAKAA